jgi:uncharacterized protein (DUF1800 family)
MPFTQRHAERLLWRAGFGGRPGEAAYWAKQGKKAMIGWLLSGGGGPELEGGVSKIDGARLDPANVYGHDVVWWLDRMVRTNRPLVEKMTLFWHDHFATNDVDTPWMLRQNRTLRRHALGSFRDLQRAVTQDPAMQQFLSLADSDKTAPNENYARELMELFTLGSGYSEQDIREASRALTGFVSDYKGDQLAGTRYDPAAHDTGVKRIFGRRGRFDWEGVVDLCLAHRAHAGYLVEKLWSFFVVDPIPRSFRGHLATLYRHAGFELTPVLGAILAHPALYARLDAPDMVKAPVVFLAGALRQVGRPVDTSEWADSLTAMGQRPFDPPSVAGWDWGPAWLSTNTIHERFQTISDLLDGSAAAVPDGASKPGTTPDVAVSDARAAVGAPWASSETMSGLQRFANAFFTGLDGDADRLAKADACQRVLRHLLLSGPDAHLH